MQLKGHLCIDVRSLNNSSTCDTDFYSQTIFLTLAFNILATLNTFTPTKQQISPKTTKSNQHQESSDPAGNRKRSTRTDKARETTPRRVSPKKDDKVKHDQKKSLSKQQSLTSSQQHVPFRLQRIDCKDKPPTVHRQYSVSVSYINAFQ